MKDLAKKSFNEEIIREHRNKWELFKYKIRLAEELKNGKQKLESDLMHKLNLLMGKQQLTSVEELELKNIQLQLDQFYLDLAKVSFIRSRAKWLKEGERDKSYVFALEKRNVKKTFNHS
ncbi:hypothetical protein AMECASPLE_030083 [Ameca splendens]|uniref:Uncharacterized protein n=1 Tax=Ameca splendens TaxID=208324 RepID=A0ABV0XUU6_9TELE